MEQHSVLIVEKDSGFARTLAQALISGSEGMCQVELCPSAENAYRLLEERHFDALISSFHLPGEDGLSLINCVQGQDPAIGTILLADADCPETLVMPKAGNQHCLTQPFDMLDFLLTVQQVLSPDEDWNTGQQGFSLLILEDDEGLRRIYSLALSKFEGCQIDEAATLEQARSLLDTRDYDILISDMRIGRERATDILDQYKQRFEDHGTKIVMCSAFGQYRNLPEDVDHFLEKPISVDKLVNLVGELVGIQANDNKE
ncbi:MAG: response regulator [Anaerolineales bacterium]